MKWHAERAPHACLELLMPGLRPRVVALISLALCLALSVAITSCAATSASTTPTVSPQTASACAAAPGFVGAKPATAGGRFPDVGFPAGSVGYSSADPEANGFQFQVIHVCLTGSAPDAVRSFVSADLPGHGWRSQDTAPVTGDLSTPCAVKPLCFARNDGAPRYVVVQEIIPGAGLTIYTLRLILQPLVSGSATLTTGQKLDFDPGAPGAPTTATPVPSPNASPNASPRATPSPKASPSPKPSPSASPSTGNVDVTWTGAQLAPANGAKLKVIGDKNSLNSVVYADLAALTYEEKPLDAGALTSGAIFAVQTADGHYAKAQVKSTNGGLSLDYITYAATF
jgi:hypothetical protein